MEEKKKTVKEIVQKMGPLKFGILIVCGVLLLIISCGNTLFGTESKEETQTTEVTQKPAADELTTYKNKMEQELMELLDTVAGVGNATVMITLKASTEKVTLKDNSADGEQNEEKTVLVEDSDNNSSPYVVQEREPEIEGIAVVCDGGDDAAIKREITDAVSALFQIESHKIKIMKSKEAKE